MVCIKLFLCSRRQKIVQKRGFCPCVGKFPQIMSKRFQAEVDFRSGKPLEPESSEPAAFLDLAEHCLRFDRTLAPVLQPLLTCKKFPCSGFISVKGMVHLYLPVPL